MSNSSCVPSIREWEARICSISVDTERGSPRMKIGSGSGAPTHSREAKNSAVHTSICWRVFGFGDIRMVAAFSALEPVAELIELPGFRVLVADFVRPAERKAKIAAIDGESGRYRFLRAHPSDFLRRKSIRLEIGKAPIGIAEATPQGCRRPI
jgi:hypothetical protein